METNQTTPVNSLSTSSTRDKKISPIFNYDGITQNDIVSDVDKFVNQGSESKGLFTVMAANKWIDKAKTRPIPKMLFGEFWYEGELCILFADTNLGKSILAVQIGNSISNGKHIQGFKFEATKQPILYFDFELSDKQFENRYSIQFQQHYIFDDNFIRVEINPDAALHYQ